MALVMLDITSVVRVLELLAVSYANMTGLGRNTHALQILLCQVGGWGGGGWGLGWVGWEMRRWPELGGGKRGKDVTTRHHRGGL